MKPRAKGTLSTWAGAWGLLGFNAVMGVGCAAHFVWSVLRLKQNEPLPFLLLFVLYAVVFVVGWVVVGTVLARHGRDPKRSIRFGIGVLLLGALLGLSATVGAVVVETVIPGVFGAGAVPVGLLLTLLCVAAAIACGVVTTAVVEMVGKTATD